MPPVNLRADLTKRGIKPSSRWFYDDFGTPVWKNSLYLAVTCDKIWADGGATYALNDPDDPSSIVDQLVELFPEDFKPPVPPEERPKASLVLYRLAARASDNHLDVETVLDCARILDDKGY